ncbi:MAG TPA: transglutaminase domain-containing protein, partial [Acidimicrobiales bacterium]|nr:transglutaminase domain-containing protein [Acidimicrobiales bacterium]
TGRFRYSLAVSSSGADPLSSFLFVTKAGFCQQFAGAYAVLARLDGLPTRLAVGFTAGDLGSDGTWHVVGADAHVWPQVYLGPSNGWVSFEPTPPAGSGPAAPGVFSGRSVSLAVPRLHANSPPATATTLLRGGEKQSAPGATTTTRPRAGAVQRARGGVSGWLWFAVAVIVIGLAVGLRRRIRLALLELWWRMQPPGTAVVGAWRAAAREMGRRGLGRAPVETLTEHAARVGRERTPAAAEFAELAALATRACYGSARVGGHEAAAARRLHRQVCRADRRGQASPPTTSRRPQS